MSYSLPSWWRGQIACEDEKCPSHAGAGWQKDCAGCQVVRFELRRHVDYVNSITPAYVFIGAVSSGACEDEFRYRTKDDGQAQAGA